MRSTLINRPALVILMIILVTLSLSACGKFHGIFSKSPKDQTKVKKKPGDKEVSIAVILSNEAENFFSQKNYQDALFTYNQALAQATDSEKPGIIQAIETTLSKTPAKDIAEFSRIKNIVIPEALLLYWLGINYALEDNTVKARQTLLMFVKKYPEHPYYTDATELLTILKKSLFKRNVIGCLLPLTGKYAVFGERALSGIQVAIKDLSEKYSTGFKLIIRDTGADPEKTRQAVQELHRAGAAGIIGPLLMVKEAGEEAQKLQIPLIALTQKSNFSLQGDYLFANFITPEMQVRTLGGYLFQDLGLEKVAILYPNEKYGRKYMELFLEMAKEYNGEVVRIASYESKSVDFSRPIRKLGGGARRSSTHIKRAKTNKIRRIRAPFQALFIPDSPSKIKLILPQLVYHDIRGVYLVGTNLWHHKNLPMATNGYNRNAVITTGFYDGNQNPASIQFIELFKSMYQKKPGFLEAISYDTASILFTAAMDTTIDSRQGLRDLLKGGRFFEGITGNTVFDENGVVHRELFLITIKGNQFIEINR